jgi:hypothetical protein
MRRISVFGATGSIGQNTLDLIARAPGAYDVVALTGGGNIAQLAEDAPPGAEVAVTAYEDRLDDLRAALAGSGSRPRRGRGADRGRGPARRLDHVGHRRRGGACAGVPRAAARHDAGAGQQGKPRHRRAAPAGRGARPRRHDPARRQRAFRDFPGPRGRGYRGGREDHHHRLGRRPSATGRWRRCPRPPSPRPRAPELGHGPADHHRQRVDVQQGHGAD